MSNTLKTDLDRLHRERDSFQQHARLLAEEVERTAQDAKRLDFLIRKGVLHTDFNGAYYVTCLVGKRFAAFEGGNDARLAIDLAMSACGE